MSKVHLAGPVAAVCAVTQALAALYPQAINPVAWVLRGAEPRCEIRGDGRTTVASTWARAVRLHLAPPVSLCQVRVVAPSGGWLS